MLMNIIGIFASGLLAIFYVIPALILPVVSTREMLKDIKKSGELTLLDFIGYIIAFMLSLLIAVIPFINITFMKELFNFYYLDKVGKVSDWIVTNLPTSPIGKIFSIRIWKKKQKEYKEN